MTTGLLIRASIYVALVVATLVVCRVNQLPLRDTLGLRIPSTGEVLLYSFLFVCLAATGEWLASPLGVAPVEKWRAATVPALVMLAITIVVLAPLAEELLFRGMLYARISRTSLGSLGAIALPAVLFTAAHYDKDATGVGIYLLVLVDGLYFGFVRYRTNSTVLTMVLHAAGNGYAVIQRMP
jgi:membrane protease YdiL (CAAX protease family)